MAVNIPLNCSTCVHKCDGLPLLILPSVLQIYEFRVCLIFVVFVVVVVVVFFHFHLSTSRGILKGSIMGFLISFVKNDEIRPRMTRGKKSTQFLKGTTRDLF